MKLSFPNHTGAEVAAIYKNLIAKGLYKLAASLLTGYANGAPSDAHFGEFFNLLNEEVR